MLFVRHGETHFNWKIGETLPPAGTVEVHTLLAEGEELDLIVSLFSHDTLTIPLSDTHVNSWYGDTARSIFDALARHNVNQGEHMR